jgi:hypothetical protein
MVASAISTIINKRQRAHPGFSECRKTRARQLDDAVARPSALKLEHRENAIGTTTD